MDVALTNLRMESSKYTHSFKLRDTDHHLSFFKRKGVSEETRLAIITSLHNVLGYAQYVKTRFP